MARSPKYGKNPKFEDLTVPVLGIEVFVQILKFLLKKNLSFSTLPQGQFLKAKNFRSKTLKF